MQMDPGEIAREYKRAADQKKQIQILAELNGCSDVEIIKILKDQKVLLPLKGGAKNKKKVAEKAGSGEETVHAVTKQITEPEAGAQAPAPVIPESLRILVLKRMDDIISECDKITEKYKELTAEMIELEDWMESNGFGFKRTII